MELLTTREFNGVALNCYKAENEADGFWATREQIGRLLGYKNPSDSIAKIHNRHKENLDRYSGMDKLSTPEGGTQETVIYNFKGFLEICRYSNQPKAEAVISFCWNIMDEIRRTGSYGKNLELNIRAAEALQKISTSSQEERERINREVFKLITGKELSKIAWTAQEIGEELGWPPDIVMLRAENLKIMKRAKNGYWDNGTWFFNKEGRQTFLELVRKKVVKIEDGIAIHENGYRHIYWAFDPEDYHGEEREWNF